MFSRTAFILGWLRRFGTSRSDLLIENLAFRQQLAILTAKRPRPRMRAAHRFFRLALRCPVLRRAAENPTWGAPRIHGEMLMLGFGVSERTISRFMQTDGDLRRALRL